MCLKKITPLVEENDDLVEKRNYLDEQYLGFKDPLVRVHQDVRDVRDSQDCFKPLFLIVLKSGFRLLCLSVFLCVVKIYEQQI